MGQAICACHADIVSDLFVAEQCPDEFAVLKTLVDEQDIDWMFLGQPNEVSDLESNTSIDGEVADQIVAAYVALTKAFEAKTGLELYGVFHEWQGKGDDIDGFVWAVDKVYKLTPAGEKYQKRICRMFWTECG